MAVNKFLFVTTFSDLSFDALESLLDMRRTGLEHVVFLNVIERQKVAMRRGTGYDKQAETKLREVANIRFIDWAERLFEQGMEVGVYIVVGDLAPQVVRSTQKEESDLVVIGRQTTGTIQRLFSGSDLENIIRRTGKPVMVYNYGPSSTAMKKPFSRPLLAVKTRDDAARAIALLTDQKEIIDELHLVHVASEKDLTQRSAMDIQQTRKEARRQLDEMCDELAAAGIGAEPHVTIGEPVEEIERVSRELHSTLMVAGAGGKGRWLKRQVKRVGTALSESLDLPVLLVP